MGKHSAPSSTAKGIAALALTGAVAASGVALAPAANAASGPDWGPIIQCESGGNPQAQNPSSTASGLFQFIDGTWKAYGGSTAKAKHASVSEQYAVANRAYAAEGYRPWAASKSCWGSKIGTGVQASVKQEQPKVDTAQKSATTQKNKVVEKKAEPRQKSVETYQALPKVTPKIPDGAKFTKDSQGEYTVKTGDTLSHIAVQHGTTVQAIVELNKDTIEHPDWVFEGERLRLK